VSRDVEQVEFVPGEARQVVEWMSRLAEARDGWINLLPGVDDDEAEKPRQPSAFSALFGSAQAPVTMSTWIPPKRGRRHGDQATVGIMHPRGRHAVSQLRSMDIPLPDGWWVRQDHARRGLIVLVPATVPHAAVLDWVLRAGGALAMVPLTGSWKAQVFLPARS
jgi:hypothetical protein